MPIEVKDGVISGDVHSGDVHITNITNIHHQSKNNGDVKVNQSENNGDVKVNWYGLMVTRNQYFSMFYIALTLTIAFLIFIWLAWESHFRDHPLGWIMIGGCCVMALSLIAWAFETKTMNKKFSEEEAKNNH